MRSRDLVLVVDIHRCMGCHSCTVACKQENDLDPGVSWTSVFMIGPVGKFPNLQMCFLPKMCMHCETAPCITACPIEALSRRRDGGVVLDEDLCNHCQACIAACPYDAISSHPVSGAVSKCNLCRPRVDAGLVPACVASCVGKAMVFGDRGDPNSQVSKVMRDAGDRLVTLQTPHGTRPRVFYIRPSNFDLDIASAPMQELAPSSEIRRTKPFEMPKWNARTAYSATGPAYQVVRTVCQDCHSRCGALAYVRDGEVVKVEGNPEHPLSRGIMCTKGLSSKQVMYHPDRLNYPLHRTRPKGDPDPGWQRITWEQAMDEISAKILSYKEDYGAESVGFGFGTGRETNHYSFRLCNTFGTPNRTGVTNLCTGPHTAAAKTVWGAGLHGVEPDYRNAKCIVNWGVNPAYSMARHTQHILDAVDNGAKLIIVDPVYHNLAAIADMWLPVRPGTDGALALAWLNVVVNEKLYDETFVSKWTNGGFLLNRDTLELLSERDAVEWGEENKPIVWDRSTDSPQPYDLPDLAPALYGEFKVNGIYCLTSWEVYCRRLEDYTPEKAADIAWLPAEDIRRAARIYATTKPASIGVHLGVTQHTNSFRSHQAINQLIAICGNADVPGGNVDWDAGIKRWFQVGWPASEMLPPGMAEKRLGAQDAPLLSGGVFASTHYTKVWDAIKTGEPYPVKALVLVASNPVNSVENSREVREALKELEFLVVLDYFMTPTGELADIVLPAAYWLERENISEELSNNYLTCRERAIRPKYERWEDEKFYNELAKYLGIGHLWWESVEDIHNWDVKPYGMTWEQFKEKYIHEIPKKYRAYEVKGFNTPTKKIELYSTTMAKMKRDPFPYWEEPVFSPVRTPELASDYPFIMVAGGRLPAYYHSAYRNIPWQREVARDPEMRINPVSAAELGIRSGDWVWIETPIGRIKQKACVTEAVHPRVVQVSQGWWQGCEFVGKEPYGWETANANLLIDNRHNDPYIGTPAMRSSLCRVYKE